MSREKALEILGEAGCMGEEDLLQAIVKEIAEDQLEPCISAGMMLQRDHWSRKAEITSPVIFPINVRGVVKAEDMKVPHSELAMHVGAAGSDILAWFLSGNGAHIVYRDEEKGCSLVSGLPNEVMSHPLIEKTREIFDPTEIRVKARAIREE